MLVRIYSFKDNKLILYLIFCFSNVFNDFPFSWNIKHNIHLFQNILAVLIFLHTTHILNKLNFSSIYHNSTHLLMTFLPQELPLIFLCIRTLSQVFQFKSNSKRKRYQVFEYGSKENHSLSKHVISLLLILESQYFRKQ